MRASKLDFGLGAQSFVLRAWGIVGLRAQEFEGLRHREILILMLKLTAKPYPKNLNPKTPRRKSLGSGG